MVISRLLVPLRCFTLHCLLDILVPVPVGVSAMSTIVHLMKRTLISFCAVAVVCCASGPSQNCSLPSYDLMSMLK